MSLLQDAVTSNHHHIAEILRSHGAEMRDSKELIAAFLQNASDGNADQVRRLLRAGISPIAKDYDSRTALHLAAAEGHLSVCETIISFVKTKTKKQMQSSSDERANEVRIYVCARICVL